MGPFSQASDRPEGQELGGGAVGGQQGLQSSSKAKLEIYDPQMVYYLLQPLQPVRDLQVNLRLLSMLDMVLVAKPMFWGMRNHLGPFSEA